LDTFPVKTLLIYPGLKPAPEMEPTPYAGHGYDSIKTTTCIQPLSPYSCSVIL